MYYPGMGVNMGMMYPSQNQPHNYPPQYPQQQQQQQQYPQQYPQQQYQPGMYMQPQMGQMQQQQSPIDAILAKLVCYVGDTNRIRNDCSYVIKQYPGLVPTACPAPFTANHLLCLDGTIPVVFRGSKYNIPIAIWIPEKYPFAPPICYVRPTQDMAVVPSTNVDNAGRITIPYLLTWNGASSNIVSLILSMIQVFGQITPVKALPRTNQSVINQMQGMSPSNQMPNQISPNQIQSGQSSFPYPQAQNQSQSQMMGNQSQMMGNQTNALISRLQTQFMLSFSEIESKVDNCFREEKKLIETEHSNQVKLETLKTESDTLDKEILQMKEEIASLTKWIEENQRTGEIDINKIAMPKTVVDRQLAKAVATAHTLDDVIYQYDNAFKQKKMDLATYLNNVREIAHEQYFARALTNKIHKVKKGE